MENVTLFSVLLSAVIGGRVWAGCDIGGILVREREWVVRCSVVARKSWSDPTSSP